MIDLVLKDPAVATVGAYIGAGGATSTENQGRIFIALKPKAERAPISTVMARLDTADAQRCPAFSCSCRRCRTSTSAAV